MKRYKFSFVGYNRKGERIVEDIRSDVPEDVGFDGIKESFAMALEQEHDCPFRCVGVEEEDHEHDGTEKYAE